MSRKNNEIFFSEYPTSSKFIKEKVFDDNNFIVKVNFEKYHVVAALV